jgi:hypothetical protein
MTSRRKFWSSVCRGAAIGAIVGLTTWLILACVLWAVLAKVPQLRQGLLAQYPDQDMITITIGFLSTFGVLILYGALSGAIIMAIVGISRANPSARRRSN